jgi:hypothetical protein
MALVIEELSTSLEVQDEVKIRKIVREEVQRALAAQRSRASGGEEADPADPAASGGPNEGAG